MAMGRRKREQQGVLWIAAQDVARSPGHPFYERLNHLLAKHGFDAFSEETCRRYYAETMGRPSTPPPVYFRMLLIGYFEGLDSERAIAWRCADSIALRAFLGYELTEAPPDHSTLSRTRRLIDVETHTAVFDWIVAVLAKEGLISGTTLGIDATTLEANAALRSIVRRDTGESYAAFLARLANASGIETPTRAALAKLDRRRANKGSNADWEHPHDPDARITKMKDGRTHLAHKVEHAVDMDTGAVVAATVQAADAGDTATMSATLAEAAERLDTVQRSPRRLSCSCATAVREQSKSTDETEADPVREVVADKGYHSNATLTELDEQGVRTYISEPARGRRRWIGKEAEQHAVYANRRRIRGARGRRLLRKRGELLERAFAHYLGTGGMRRVHLRGRGNILKRLLVHIGGFNLGLILRRRFGVGTPRGLQGLRALASRIHQYIVALLRRLIGPERAPIAPTGAYRDELRQTPLPAAA